MKIVLVNEEYPKETNFGGISTYQKISACEYVKQGHDVTVICRGLNKNQKYIEDGVKVIRIYEPSTNDKKKDYINYRKKVKDILINMQENNEIDIIETPDWGAETILFEPYRNVPLVVRLHTPLKVWLKYNKNNYGNVTKIMLKWEKKLIKNADLVTCCSKALLEEMKKDFKGLEKVVVTPNPADLSNFYRDDSIKKEKILLYVGSVEERKGVIVLAKALNIVLKKIPDLKVEFIGKDTNRNIKNISTFQYINDTIKDKYRDRIKFYGQLDNDKISYYMNKAMIGVYPSLFDNFPYVVLESMATGLQIVGSSNSGIVEMLGKYGSIYETGNVESLADKIIERYKIAQKEKVNKQLIKRVREEYNPTNVCKKMLDYYKTIYKNYNNSNIKINDIKTICKKQFGQEKFKIKKLNKKAIANDVYLLRVNKKKYLLKKYNYKYDFNLEKKLYDICEKNNINYIKPINENIYNIGSNDYNIFKFIRNKRKYKSTKKFFLEYLKMDREISGSNDLINKIDNYYKNISKINYYNSKIKKEIDIVKNIYLSTKKINKNEKLYINHGDLSNSNLLYNRKYYLIDFDETIITYELYDFAVIIVKNYVKNNKINYKKVNEFLIKSNLNNKYSISEVNYIIKIYLCKILLEKFYLHLIGKIDLFNKNQQLDNYKKYYDILVNME